MEVLTHLNVTTALGLENSRRLIPTNYVAHLNSNTRPFLLFSSHRTCNDCNTQSLKQMGKFSFWRTCRAQLRDDVESNSEEATKCPSHVGDIEKEAMSLANRYALSVSQHLQSGTVIMRLHNLKKLINKESRDQKRRWRKYKRSTDGDVPEHLLPKVVIVGRPNVGKSALFNRLVGKNIAIVADEPGVTRDRVYGRSYWKDKEFVLVDTGGVVTIADSQRIGTDGLAITKGSGEEDVAFAAKEANAAGLPSMIEKQAVLAVKEASAIIFVVDGQVGVTASDTEIANWLRKNYSNKNIALAVNKCESPRKGLLQASEFWSFGFVPLPISAIAGTGIQELLNCISIGLEAPNNVTVAEEHNLAIAIVGKPNVGKSSILNALLREERTIVSSISGTTRDAIDTDYTGPDGKIYRLIDTAGIRRRVAVAAAGSITESLSVKQAFQAIRRADVVALVIDAMACITEQDCRIAERIQMEGKACIIVVNKWDTVPDKNSKTTYYYEHDVRQKLRILSWAPIVYISATSGEKVDKIINIASAAGDERSKRLGTSVLNQVVQESLAFKQPPMTKTGKRGRIYYCTQAAVHPPTFIFFVNETKLFPDAYRRYMEKCLRSNIGFPGTPIRLLWRNRRREEKEFNNKASATAPTSVG